ncbi:OsmC family protein [Sphingobacterium sp. Mn56C]|uniref:OsmC family protein n=1 Tax=Sphingobacterium sp. Mn56C TaxID=3395261 RepID=UPI003BBAE8ED
MSKKIETLYKGKYTSNTKTPLNEDDVVVNAVSFTPVDLLVSAYGSCLLGTIDYEAHKKGFEVVQAKSEITYNMSEDGSKVSLMNIKLTFEKDYTADEKTIIENATVNCHVGKSLDPSISRNFDFNYNQKKSS